MVQAELPSAPVAAPTPMPTPGPAPAPEPSEDWDARIRRADGAPQMPDPPRAQEARAAPWARPAAGAPNGGHSPEGFKPVGCFAVCGVDGIRVA